MTLMDFVLGFCIPGPPANVRNRRRKKETKHRKTVKKWPRRSSLKKRGQMVNHIVRKR